jgi:uncharacterized protein with PIN domain
MPSHPRFIVDSMLGHVARWLRLLGYDTLYFRKVDDWKLIKISKEEDRILITRDLSLYRRARKQGLRAFFVEDPNVEDVLAELSKRFGVELEFHKDDTRCPHCNTRLVYTTSIAEIAHKVSKPITLRYKEFWVCPLCKKVYWQGTHWKSINQVLEGAKVKKAKLISKVSIGERKIEISEVGEKIEYA